MATAASIDLNALGKQLETMLRQSAADYLTGHASDVAALGQDAVSAIFATQVLAQLPPITPLAPDASAAAIATVEAICQARDEQFQLVSQAELHDAQRVAKLKSDAGAVLGTVAKAVAGIAFGTAVKFLVPVAGI